MSWYMVRPAGQDLDMHAARGKRKHLARVCWFQPNFCKARITAYGDQALAISRRIFINLLWVPVQLLFASSP